VYEALKTEKGIFFPGWKDMPDVKDERDACIVVMRRWVADAVIMDYAEGLVNALRAQHGLEYQAHSDSLGFVHIQYNIHKHVLGNGDVKQPKKKGGFLFSRKCAKRNTILEQGV
jgi:hypothetical protein